MPELIVPIRRRGALVKVVVRSRPDPATGLPQITGPLLAYLDSGASDTMLDDGIIQGMGLSATRRAALNVLGRAEVSFHDSYEIEIALHLPDAAPHWVPLAVLGGPVYGTGAVVALGRDFLRRVTFTYDGPKQRATVRW